MLELMVPRGGAPVIAKTLQRLLFSIGKVSRYQQEYQHSKRPHVRAPCPLYPQKRTFQAPNVMSALCHKRTSDTAHANALLFGAAAFVLLVFAWTFVS